MGETVCGVFASEETLIVPLKKLLWCEKSDSLKNVSSADRIIKRFLLTVFINLFFQKWKKSLICKELSICFHFFFLLLQKNGKGAEIMF